MTVGKTSIYRFEDVLVDPDTFRVSKSGSAVPLEPKAFQVLVYLIANRGRVVDKSEILDAVWKESFVTQNAMTRVIARLRKALGDDPKQPRFIKTVQTRGYLFMPEVAIGERIGSGVARVGSPEDKSRRIESLAVLPLENLSDDPSQEYFADAMTDELITEIARLGALRVISRTSVMQYKRVRKPLPVIARELNVDAVVEGSAIRAGNRVRITAQLLHAASDTHLWAESYERDLSDILALQKEVARAIAREVHIKLTPQERARLASARSVSPEACDEYLKGIYYFGRGRDLMPARKDLLRKSVKHFERAIMIEPEYAAAHSGLAIALRWLASYSDPSFYPQAKRTAMRAIALDPTNAEAHAALGWILFKYDWDWSGAERHYRLATELNPNAMYHQGYALLLSSLARHEEAISRVRLAELFDPLNLTVKAVVGMVTFFAGQFDRAIEQLQNTVELDPNIALVRLALGWSYERTGQYSKAIQEIKEAMSLAKSDLFGAGFLGHAYARSGDRREASAVLEGLIEASKRRYVPPYYQALILAGLGDRGRALDRLEKSLDSRDDFASYIKVDPRFDDLRREPRFVGLLRRMGLAG
jgi:adenylate cyclase